MKFLVLRKPKSEKESRKTIAHNVVSAFSNLVVREFYSVNKPFGHVAIMLEKDTRRHIYYVIEPSLNDIEVNVIKNLVNIIKQEDINVSLDTLRDRNNVIKYLQDRVRSLIKKYKFAIDENAVDKIIYYVIRDFVGYGMLDVVIRDENVEDISCDGVGIPVYVWHRLYEYIPTNIVFKTLEELDSYVIKLLSFAGKQISVAKPIEEGMLPEGYRVHAILRDVTRRGPAFSIRKFFVEPITLIDLIKVKTINAEAMAYLWLLIEHKRPVMILGEMAAGKTTLLNTLLGFIRPEMKITTIEETPELNILHDNWVSLVIRPSTQPGVENITMFELLKSSLRQRPDYIVVGEIRGEEAYMFFQALAVGHGGLCTMHSDSIESAIKRLISKPMDIPSHLVPLINSMVLMTKLKKEEQVIRRVLEISEIVNVSEKGEVKLNTVFMYDKVSDNLKFLGNSVIFEKIAKVEQTTPYDILNEMERRKQILEWMSKNNIRRREDIAKVIRAYYLKPETVMEHVRLNLTDLGGLG